MVSAYTQVELGGDIPYYMIIPAELVAILDPEVKVIYLKMKRPVVELGAAVYGLGRSGGDFIHTFGGWLNINQWYTVPEETALHVYWVTEDPSVILRRAAANKKYVDAERRRGRNVLLERKKGGQLTTDHETARLEKMKRIAGTSGKAVVMATYVDDCDMDGRKDLRNVMWAVVRMYFESAEPEDVKKFLGIIHDVCIEEPKLYVTKLSQHEYLMNLLNGLPE